MIKRLSPYTWIIPCNNRYFNLSACFEKYGETYWTQHNDFQAGDEAYIYVCRPYSAIRYLVDIVETDMPYDAMMDFKQQFYGEPGDDSWKRHNRFAHLRMTAFTRSPQLSLEKLKEHGLRMALDFAGV